MSCHKNTGQYRNLMTDNKSFGNMAKLKHLGTTVTNKNYIREKIKSRLYFENAC